MWRGAAFEFYNKECEIKRNELSVLCSEIEAKKNFIQDLDNHKGYLTIKEAAKKESKILMQANYVSCYYSFCNIRSN